MQEIVQTLSDQLGRPVVDATGLKGKYDFDITWIVDTSEIQAMLSARGVPMGRPMADVPWRRLIPADPSATRSRINSV